MRSGGDGGDGGGDGGDVDCNEVGNVDASLHLNSNSNSN